MNDFYHWGFLPGQVTLLEFTGYSNTSNEVKSMISFSEGLTMETCKSSNFSINYVAQWLIKCSMNLCCTNLSTVGSVSGSENN